MLFLIAVALQAAPAASPERFSILVPVNCPAPASAGDIVVCAAPQTPRLPLPDERIPAGPVPSNPHVSGTGALAAEGTPCAATQWGCQVGFGPPIMPIVAGAVDLLKGVLAKKPDKRGRVPIPMDDPAPAN